MKSYPDILKEIIKHKKKEVSLNKQKICTEKLKEIIFDLKSGETIQDKNICSFLHHDIDGNDIKRGQRFSTAISEGNTGLIAEIKKASPSKGILSHSFNPISRAKQYEANGASAISVLTDRFFFRGRLEDLMDVRTAVELPILRKDFIIDTYQVYETWICGADALLLIARALEPDTLSKLLNLALEIDLGVLIEVHNRIELNNIINILEQNTNIGFSSMPVIGINNRNLDNFSVDIGVTEKLISDIPGKYPVVSESGIHSKEQVNKLKNVGVDALLIGEYLMKDEKITSRINSLF